MMKIELPVWLDRRWIECPYCGMTDKAKKWLKHDNGKHVVVTFNGERIRATVWSYSCPNCWRHMSEALFKCCQFKGGIFRPGNGFEMM